MFEDVSGLITHDYGFRFSRKTKAYNTASVVYVLVRVSRVRAPVQMDGRCRHLFTDGCGDADSRLRCRRMGDAKNVKMAAPGHATLRAGLLVRGSQGGRRAGSWRGGAGGAAVAPRRPVAEQRRSAREELRPLHVEPLTVLSGTRGTQPQSAAISRNQRQSVSTQ